MTSRGASVACGLLLGAVTADAHHSISGAYDTRRDVRIEGVVTQFEFINPHAFVTLEVRETGRAAQPWRVELDDRGELSEIGMTAQTLQPGDRVIVVPFRLFGFGGYAEVLDGLTYTPADGLLPHVLISDWIEESAAGLFCGEGIATPLGSCSSSGR